MSAIFTSMPREDWILILLPLFLLTTQIRNIKYVAPASGEPGAAPTASL